MTKYIKILYFVPLFLFKTNNSLTLIGSIVLLLLTSYFFAFSTPFLFFFSEIGSFTQELSRRRSFLMIMKPISFVSV